MASSKAPLTILPGKGLGFLLLGSSLHDVIARLKLDVSEYPKVDVSISPTNPVISPIIVELKQNGLRLRFDGQDQRLRLIEITDFRKTPLLYKNQELAKTSDGADQNLMPSGATGPTFRQIYHRLFGPTFAGEYFPPRSSREDSGTYVLSYPGIAFSFGLQHSAYSPKEDFVSLLSSSAATPAKALSIFNGPSWKEARQDYLTRAAPHPRSLSLAGRGKDGSADEIEMACVKSGGRIELTRKTSSFTVVLGETTPQDLVAELGPPDVIYRKYDRKMDIHEHRSTGRSDPAQADGYSDTDLSSTHTDYSSPDDDAAAESAKPPSTECFYNYYNHGIDVLVSFPTETTPGLRINEQQEEHPLVAANVGKLVATKIIIHGNVPGSYSFHRYRRCRWTLDVPAAGLERGMVTSEMRFPDISERLQPLWALSGFSEEDQKSMQRPMVLNRDWGDSPSSSFDFADIMGSEDDLKKSERLEPSFGNTKLHGFPGLLFEVLKNDSVSFLTVY